MFACSSHGDLMSDTDTVDSTSFMNFNPAAVSEPTSVTLFGTIRVQLAGMRATCLSHDHHGADG